MKAIWKNKVIAESDDIINVEGNSYFPENSIKAEYFDKSDTQTVCHWKGTASYYHLKIEGEENKDAAWFYPDPSELAKNIKGRIAFWRGVNIVQ